MDPLREEAHRDLIRVYVASGQPAAALRQHRELERMLEKDLKEAPDTTSHTLVQDIVSLSSGRRDSLGGRRAIGATSDPPSASLATAFRVSAFSGETGSGLGSETGRLGLGERPPVGGAVPVGSVFYVARSTDAPFHAAIERRESIVQIQAPSGMGKSSLLAQGLQRARENGSRVAWTDLQVLGEADLQSADRLFPILAEWLADQLDLDVLPHHVHNPHLGPSVNFERYLRREVLEKSAAPLVWGLDEVNRLFATACGSQVRALFCSWHNRRGLDPAGPWGRITLAMTYATDDASHARGEDGSPLPVGTRLTLTEFTVEEVADLNRRHDSPLASPAEIETFYHRLGGHPYRVSRGLWDLSSRGMGIDAFMAQTEPDGESLLRKERRFEPMPDRRLDRYADSFDAHFGAAPQRCCDVAA